MGAGPAAGRRLGEVLEGVQVKGRVQQALQLRHVGLLVAGGWGCRRVPASVPGGGDRAVTAKPPGGRPFSPPAPRAVAYHTGLARLMVVRSRGFT